MKFLFGFLLFIFLCNSGYSQIHEISLDGYKLSSPLKNAKVIKVIDLRADKSNIGWVNIAMGTKKVPAHFSKDLIIEIEGLINKNTISSEKIASIVLKINKFNVLEKLLGDKQIAKAEISLEFLAQENGNLYKLIDASSIKGKSTYFDITKSHPENIIAALNECIAKLNSINIQEKINPSNLVGIDYLSVNNYYNISSLDLPILKASSYKKGIYTSFQEFRDNNPKISEQVTVNKKNEFVSSVTGKKVENVWGFSNGTTPYIYYQGIYFPMIKKEGYFTFSALVQKSGPTYIFAGSAICLAITTGLALTNALTTETTKVDFIVNMVTGNVSEANEYAPLADLAKKARVIIYRNEKGESSETLNVFVNDSLYANLTPGSYLALTFGVPVNQLNICLKAKDQTCMEFTPVLDNLKYLECGLSTKTGSKPTIKQVKEQEGVYYMKILKNHPKYKK